VSADPLFARLADLLADGPSVFASTGDLAAKVDPTNVQTSALDLVDAALVDVAEGRCDRLIISLPPQEGKSTRVTRYGALWMLMRNPHHRIAIVSYSDQVAQQFSYAVRNDITTFDGSEGNVDLGLRLRKDNKAASRWFLESPARGGVYAIGIGGSLTGRPVDALVIDDPVKDYRAADSQLLSELAWQWWMSVARPRLAPGAPVIVVLTRWHENDLAGRLLAKQAEDEASGAAHFDRWRVINIPAQADHDPAKGEVDLLGRAPGEFMTSARGRTREQWEATRQATAPRIWSALYQGRPSPDQGVVFLRQWMLRYLSPIWTTVGMGYRIPEADQVIQSWDLAFKSTDTSDFVVGQVWARIGKSAYLVDQIRRRMSFTETLSAVKALSVRWPQASAKLIEEKANGSAVIDALKRELPGIVAVNPGSDSKFARANSVAPFVESGNVWLPSAEIALFPVDEFIEELVAFPNSSHDDQVDAAAQALTRLLARQQGGALVISPVGWRGSGSARMGLPGAEFGSPFLRGVG
jgi:predicted phage terminase large subunit-like protein